MAAHLTKKRPARRKRARKSAPVIHEGPAPAQTLDGIAGVRDAALWVILFCATLVAYWPAVHGSLLWDDANHVTRPALQSLHGLWRIWFEPRATQQYYPLLYSSFWLEHRLWGDAVTGYHLTNITLHALSAGLVVLIARRLSLAGSWLAGFLFALHPVLVEGVAWISEQKSTLSGFFCLAAALAYLHFDEKRRASIYVLATGLFTMALLSKSVTAMLPPALLVVLWWKRGRLELRRDALPLLPWLTMGASMGIFTAWFERTIVKAQGAGFDDLTLIGRVLVAGRAIFFYLSKLIWLINLTFNYPRWHINPAVWWQYLFPAGVVAVGVVLLRISSRKRGPLATFLIFIGVLFPALGFLNVYPFRYSWVADHFQYLASLAIILPAASLLTRAIERFLPGKFPAIAAPAALIAALGVLSWRQTPMYRDDYTLFSETAARNPDSWLAHNWLGNMFFRMPGRESDAIAEYERAVRLEPDYAEAYTDLGEALKRFPNRLTEAIPVQRAAVRLRPDLPETHANLGSTLAQIPARLPEAIGEFEAALRLDPSLPQLHYDLGIAFLNTPNRLPDGIRELEAAIKIAPTYTQAHYGLANALSHTPGRIADAIAEYETVLRIRPDFQPAEQALERLQGTR